MNDENNDDFINNNNGNINKVQNKNTHKIAMCFLISGKQTLNHENYWKEWISKNESIINVYFHYKDYDTISSDWIKSKCIPRNYISKTSYYYVLNAYLNILSFALNHDNNNTWFCFCTEKCLPIMNPIDFKKLFLENKYKSIIKTEKCKWNVQYHKRANLNLFPSQYHLYNEPWFILTRSHGIKMIEFVHNQYKWTKLINQGIIANESFFAIALYYYGILGNEKEIIDSITHLTNWDQNSGTHPYTFTNASTYELDWINHKCMSVPNNKLKYIFIRKIDASFPVNALSYLQSFNPLHLFKT